MKKRVVEKNILPEIRRPGNGKENLRINWYNKSRLERGCKLDTPPPHLPKYIQDGNY
jgi:hypothetical protein